MINPQAKGSVEVEPSANGGFVIKAVNGPRSQAPVPMGISQNKQELFTAGTIDEVMIIVREQLEKITA